MSNGMDAVDFNDVYSTREEKPETAYSRLMARRGTYDEWECEQCER